MLKLIFRGFIALSITSLISYYLVTSNESLTTLEHTLVQEMTTGITDELNSAMPLINQAGYKVFAIQAQITLPPRVNAIFELDHFVEKSKQEIILKALEGNTIGKMVLSSLMQAFELDETISIQNMDLKRINITISLPPAVTLDYR